MLRTSVAIALLLCSVSGFGQSAVQDWRDPNVAGANQAAADQQRRRVDLRAILRTQAQRNGPVGPRSLSSSERAQLRAQLQEERQQALLLHP